MGSSPYGSMGTRVGDITTVGISDTIRSDLGLKGGGLPQFVLPDQAEIEFVYLLNPNITVTAASSIPVRTSQTDSIVVPALTPAPTDFPGSALLVPDGCSRVFLAAYVTAFTAAGAATTSSVFWEASNDGINWSNNEVPNAKGNNSVALSGVGDGFDNYAQSGGSGANALPSAPANVGLPKYIRAVFRSNSTLNDFTVNLVVTVS